MNAGRHFCSLLCFSSERGLVVSAFAQAVLGVEGPWWDSLGTEGASGHCAASVTPSCTAWLQRWYWLPEE